MIFSLEALQAQKGDCLVLSWGKSASEVRHIVIDGGPDGIWEGSLSKRLAQLRKSHAVPKGEALTIEMVMVSHIDDDHINGVLGLFTALEDAQPAVPYRIGTLWFNSFDDIVGNGPQELKSKLASLSAGVAAGKVASAAFSSGERGRHSAAILASVGQGRDLRSKALGLKILVNAGFKGLVMTQTKPVTVPLADDLKLHVISPSLKRLTALNDEWEKDVAKHPSDAKVAAFTDNSVANLSSIVVVAEFGGKTMLLTGDARGDDILAGLTSAGFINNPKKGKVHFDVLKMPHHGSNRDMTLDFLQRITADHYVISANGENTNPDADTIEWIAEARQGDSYLIHLTNEKMVDPAKKNFDVGKAVKDVLSAHKIQKQALFRPDSALSLCVDLFDALKL
ncbi:MAG TPA: hypothetical protein VGK29_20210 [Paludibaculum sp.]